MDWFTWTPLEVAGNIFTLVCIVLAGRNNIHTWWTGLVGCSLFFFMYYINQLYADATLQIFFVFTGIIGWINWNKKSNSQEIYKISKVSNKNLMLYSIIAALVAMGYGFILHNLTDAYAPWIDSTIMAFSILAQLLLMKRYIQNWPFWLLVNTLSVPLFWSKGLYLTSILYAGFWFNAIYSYFHWKKLYKAQ